MAHDGFDAESYYREKSPFLQRLSEEAEFAVLTTLQTEDIKVHGVTSRVKTRESFLEKIVRKDYSDPATQVEDLVGVRIVCLYESDLEKVSETISKLFHIVSTEDKINSGPADSFGYMSMHHVCRIPRKLSGPRYLGLHEISFEIQIRTILMDAWANVSHHLAYKGETSIPEDLRRDFHALAGLFYVADSHFELLSQRAREADKRAEIQEPPAERRQDSEITPLNLSTMQAYLRRTFAEREEIRPIEPKSVSNFVEEIAEFGYDTIQKIDADLEPLKSNIARYEMANPPTYPGDDGHRYYSPVGLARIGLAIANDNYAESKYKDDAHTYKSFRS